MDDQRFDRLTRTLGATGTRRRTLGMLAGLLAGVRHLGAAADEAGSLAVADASGGDSAIAVKETPRSRPARDSANADGDDSDNGGSRCPASRRCPGDVCCAATERCAVGEGVCCPAAQVCTVGQIPNSCCPPGGFCSSEGNICVFPT